MMKWEELNGYQKAAFWLFIGLIGWFAPEIALLFHFGGIEVTFAFLALYFTPLMAQIKRHYSNFKDSFALAYVTIRHSSKAKSKVYFTQAIFCTVAFVLTSSVAFSAIFFMPSLMLNEVLTI
jgi:hypothetical protein